MKKLWQRIPGVFYGLAILGGITLYYRFPYPLIVGITGKNRIAIFGFYTIALLSFLNAHICDNPTLTKQYYKGTGYYQVCKIRRSITTNKGFYNYQGHLQYFKCDEGEFYNLPCYITAQEGPNRYKGSCDYVIKGALRHIEHGLYRLDIEEITKVPYTFSLAELRLKLKDKMRAHLKKHVKDRLTYGFFSSLGTGEIENQMLAKLFSRAGLSHTLAISGFHYTWLLIALWAVVSSFFPGRATPMILIVIITLYFLFIGETPSLKRAWLASTIYCVSVLFTQRANGLNSLGIASGIAMTLDPDVIYTIGYQLSYLATFAILAIYPYLDKQLQKFVPERTKQEREALNPFDQLIIGLASLGRRLLVLTFVVNIITFPVGLHYFGYYPLAGPLFNLFFPWAITLSLLGIFVGLLPFIGPSVLHLNAWYSKHLLEMVYWNRCGGLLIWEMSGVWLAYWVMGIVVLGLWLEGRRLGLTRIWAVG